MPKSVSHVNTICVPANEQRDLIRTFRSSRKCICLHLGVEWGASGGNLALGIGLRSAKQKHTEKMTH